MGCISQPRKIRLAVLISGRGSNLQSIIDACRIDLYPAEIKVVISNIPGAPGLTRAEKAGIPTRIVSHKNHPSKADFEADLLSALREFDIDLICLAGFMRILSPDFINAWSGRIINIHPSLLPKYQGLDTYNRAIQSGDTESGCSVHIVTEKLDDGEILIQRSVPILPNDTAETLSTRILEQEHIAYPDAIRIMASRLFLSE